MPAMRPCVSLAESMIRECYVCLVMLQVYGWSLKYCLRHQSSKKQRNASEVVRKEKVHNCKLFLLAVITDSLSHM